MFPALQPSRPKYPPQQQQQQQPSPHPSHQQIRTVSQHSYEPPAPPPNQTSPNPQPEAMPPHPTSPSHPPTGPPIPAHNPATRHPVFFTEHLRKSPFPLPFDACRGFSPVAAGYIFDARRSAAVAAGRTKL
ncbi:hypothetical protein LTR50_004959 [Elasticomyces elasticus]|nr:hypothetical protein LTR50_004959 [Elasticomyces elasticus]